MIANETFLFLCEQLKYFVAYLHGLLTQTTQVNNPPIISSSELNHATSLQNDILAVPDHKYNQIKNIVAKLG